MLKLGSYSAWIEVDGNMLEPYGEERNGDENRVSCWVASTAGKAFSVFWDDNLRKTSTCGYLNMDGKQCSGRYLNHCGQPPGKPCRIESTAFAPGKRRTFMFAELQTTDEEGLDTLATGTEHIGEIVLILWSVEIKNDVDFRHIKKVPDEMKVHELSKKAGTHCVKFGSEISKTRRIRDSRKIFKDPQATFVFRYRPLSLLQANGIAPLQHTTQRKRRAESPAEEETKPESEDEDQLADDSDEERRLKALEDEIRLIREKRSGKARAKRAKIVKAEPIPSGIFQPGEVIDLT